MEPIERMRRRLSLAKEESDTTYFHELMYMGEMLLKLTTLGLLSAVQDEKDRHHYRIEATLVRADGIGSWVQSLDDILTGTASQHLSPAARPHQTTLSQRVGDKGDWRYQTVALLREVCQSREAGYEATPARPALRSWFSDFAWLRNHTRGHGAPTPGSCSTLCPPLSESIELLASGLPLFSLPWVYLHRNLSGKYRVVPFAGSADELSYLRRETMHTYADGPFVVMDTLLPVPLLHTDVDLGDFYLANGGLKGATFELLSYITDQRIPGDATPYASPPGSLPKSETTSLGLLELQGAIFGNLPPPIPDYVARPDLEADLARLLVGERHPVVSLVGRGGIGKTSLALQVLHDLSAKSRFMAMVWFSARDLDLLPEGPKVVGPDVVTDADIANQLVSLLEPTERKDHGFLPLEYFEACLGHYEPGPLLLVFDNFETVRDPLQLYSWLDTHVRFPNQLLITTRFRDFKGDYPIEVPGMATNEFEELVLTTAQKIGLTAELSQAYVGRLYEESGGHPYVAKVMLGEVATAGSELALRRVMAGRDDVLDALFERSFSQLHPAAQRVFLTLCNWRSTVPRLVLEAVLRHPSNDYMDVDEAIEILRRSSLIDVRNSEADGSQFLSVPLAGGMFGKRKLTVSPMRVAIEADTQVLRLVGAAGQVDVRHGLEPRIRRLFHNIATLLDPSPNRMKEFIPLLEYIGRGYPPGYLLLADLYIEAKPAPNWLTKAEDSVRSYLEAEREDWSAWLRLASLCKQRDDYVGEINALLQASRRPEIPFDYASNAANRFNMLVHSGQLQLDVAEKRVIVRELLEVLESRAGEADGGDFSRMAWLSLHAGDQSRARRLTKQGREREPDNPHLEKLSERLARR